MHSSTVKTAAVCSGRYRLCNSRIGLIRLLISWWLGSEIFNPFWNSAIGLLKHAVDGGSGDPVGFGQLAQAAAVLSIAEYGRTIEFERLAADVTAFEPGAPHAG